MRKVNYIDVGAMSHEDAIKKIAEIKGARLACGYTPVHKDPLFWSFFLMLALPAVLNIILLIAQGKI